MGYFYKGIGWNKTRIGEIKKGYVYKGVGLYSKVIGEYKDNTLYPFPSGMNISTAAARTGSSGLWISIRKSS